MVAKAAPLLDILAYLADAQAMTHTGSFVWDVRTKDAVHLSDEWYRIFELDCDTSARVFRERWQRVVPDDRVRLQAAIDRAISERSGYELEARIIVPSGATKYIRIVARPVLGVSADVVQFIGSVMDITDRKQADDEREKLHALEVDLAHINRVSMMGEFAAVLAHELKQPLTGVITNAGTCLRLLRCEPPNVRDTEVAAARIIRDGNRANDIIDRLRSFYRKDVPALREPVDVNDLVNEMLMLLRAEASRHSVAMHTELATALPAVMADRVQLQQVLMNLLLNAIEAMKDRGGEVTVTSQGDRDGHVLIAVKDTGVGLPANADQMFNAFVTTKPQGSGMGLAIGRSIVESHGGRLWATANSGPGATFHLTLPITPAVAAAETTTADG